MLVEESISKHLITYNDLYSDFIFEFLQSFDSRKNLDFRSGDRLEFSISGRHRCNKINPLIKFAEPEDVDDIISIYQDIYENSYPYKEMEDPDEILAMIESQNTEFFVFQNFKGENLGCFTLILDFQNKMGYTRGLNIRKKYLGRVDVLKAFMGCFLGACIKYDDKIFRWYGESRTAHSKSQFIMRLCGFRPVGFYPNKDFFYNKIESDILIISYDERALREYRSKKLPLILPKIENSFIYSDKKFNLGDYELFFPKIRLDTKKLIKLKRKLKKKIIRDKFGYHDILFYFTDSESYFKFLYTPRVQNFEKTKYKVKDLEELYIFAQEFKNAAKEFNVRYFEVFVSAYNTEHQKIFSDLGMIPRGYVPSWKFNDKSKSFEDYVLFNHNEEKIADNMQLLEKGKELLRYLGYTIENKII